MEKHPSYAPLKGYLQKYPELRGAIYQAYNDILYGQQWSEVQILDAPQINRVIVSGKRPEHEGYSFVIPCGLEETVSIDWLARSFEGLSDAESSEVYIGITSDDSSIVYYKISRGIVKPKN